MVNNILKDKSIKLFIFLAGIFVANAVIAEVIGVKIFSLEKTLGFEPLDYTLFGEEHMSFSLTAGALPWPVIFIFTDIINEYYGVKGVRFLSYLTAILITVAFFILFGVIQLTPADWWVTSKTNDGVPDMQKAVQAIFGQGLYIIIGSIMAFIVGQIADAFVFSKIKRFTGENKIWLRATTSTLFSQLIDSYVVIFIAFYFGSNWSVGKCFAIGTNNYIYKFFMAIAMTPMVYVMHYVIERYLGKALAGKMKIDALGK
jgi:queuosine precursor transporter